MRVHPDLLVASEVPMDLNNARDQVYTRNDLEESNHVRNDVCQVVKQLSRLCLLDENNHVERYEDGGLKHWPEYVHRDEKPENEFSSVLFADTSALR